MANPAPLASILWLDDQLESAVKLDSIITVSLHYSGELHSFLINIIFLIDVYLRAPCSLQCIITEAYMIGKILFFFSIVSKKLMPFHTVSLINSLLLNFIIISMQVVDAKNLRQQIDEYRYSSSFPEAYTQIAYAVFNYYTDFFSTCSFELLTASVMTAFYVHFCSFYILILNENSGFLPRTSPLTPWAFGRFFF